MKAFGLQFSAVSRNRKDFFVFGFAGHGKTSLQSSAVSAAYAYNQWENTTYTGLRVGKSAFKSNPRA